MRQRPAPISISHGNEKSSHTEHSTENQVITTRMSCPGPEAKPVWGTEFRFEVRSLSTWIKSRQFHFNSVRIERKVSRKFRVLNFFRDRRIGVAAPSDTRYTGGGSVQTDATFGLTSVQSKPPDVTHTSARVTNLQIPLRERDINKHFVSIAVFRTFKNLHRIWRKLCN